ERRVRLLRSGRVYARADAALLRIPLQRRSLVLLFDGFPALAHELADGRHVTSKLDKKRAPLGRAESFCLSRAVLGRTRAWKGRDGPLGCQRCPGRFPPGNGERARRPAPRGRFARMPSASKPLVGVTAHAPLSDGRGAGAWWGRLGRGWGGGWGGVGGAGRPVTRDRAGRVGSGRSPAIGRAARSASRVPERPTLQTKGL